MNTSHFQRLALKKKEQGFLNHIYRAIEFRKISCIVYTNDKYIVYLYLIFYFYLKHNFKYLFSCVMDI